MFLKNIIKYCKTEKTYHTYYRLCESYRDEFGMPRQRMLLGLGRLLEIPDIDQKILLASRINELIKGTPTLFNANKDQAVDQLAQHFYRELKVKKKIDKRPGETDDASMAHLHLGLLAYWLVVPLRYQLKNKGINHDWRELVRIMNTQKRVTTTIKGDENKTIHIKQCSEPIVSATQIYQALNYKPIPLPRKKSVWHTEKIFKQKPVEFKNKILALKYSNDPGFHKQPCET